MRCGQASAQAIGVRMSGCPSCASSEPSAYSTSECTTLCGWMMVSIFSFGKLNNQRASMTSSPLFIIVAESTEILRPIAQVGCAQACSGVMRAKPSAGSVRNGPPEAVRMMRRSPGAVSPMRVPAGRHWKMALCSLSTGNSVAPWRRTASSTSCPPITSDSLLASKMRLPAFAAASTGGKPAAPTMAAMTTCVCSCAAMSHKPRSPGQTSVFSPAFRNWRAKSLAAASGTATKAGRNCWHSASSASRRLRALRAKTRYRCG